MLSRFIALSLILSVAFGALTWTNPTSFDPAQTTVTPGSNGYTVTLSNVGWVYGDQVPVAPSGPTTSWATLLRSTGTTAIGLVGASCTNPITGTAAPGNLGTLDNLAGNSCPADFATVYTTRPAAGSTTSSTALTNAPLTVNDPVGWQITQPVTAAGNQVGISVTDEASNPPTSIPVTTAGQPLATTGNSATEFATASLAYTLYLQTTGAASACFQNEAQFNSAPGDCGEILSVVGHTPSSAGIVSTSACIFVALIAFIFYN